MVDVQRTTSQNDRTVIDERFGTRISYQFLIENLELEKVELIEPKDENLIRRLNMCNALFPGVQTAREGVLDAVALKTISSYARLQTKAIDQRTSTEDAFQLIRQCAKIIRTNRQESDDVFSDFYLNFQNCHKVVPTMNFMSNRLPTNWFEKRREEKSLIKERTRRTRNVFDLSQRTQIVEVKNMSTDGEQTSKEIIRIHRCLENAFEQNENRPIGFFLFTIHPKHFSRSVENIFHLSFLIKENKVELFLDENQLPVLRPTGQMSQSKTTKSDQIHSLTQLILSLDMEQWENLIQVFQIAQPMIED